MVTQTPVQQRCSKPCIRPRDGSGSPGSYTYQTSAAVPDDSGQRRAGRRPADTPPCPRTTARLWPRRAPVAATVAVGVVADEQVLARDTRSPPVPEPRSARSRRPPADVSGLVMARTVLAATAVVTAAAPTATRRHGRVASPAPSSGYSRRPGGAQVLSHPRAGDRSWPGASRPTPIATASPRNAAACAPAAVSRFRFTTSATSTRQPATSPASSSARRAANPVTHVLSGGPVKNCSRPPKSAA